ncbi:uncharacterized protein LOC108115489 [Drosophila eugracilis]|uniref:uncharacterized protein LOC108115489 n=1 Tax=Drosophila eugracilis TaxID=29029 RepID=UPI001BD9806F|nr:uncharacterized protein LOC108115489 [Drosophila eugracilis]
MNRRRRSKTSFASSTGFYFENYPLGSQALLAARLKRKAQSRTSFDSTTGYYSYTDRTSLRKDTVTFSASPKFLQNAKFKLIALYEDQKCLWNQCHKDFFNFDRKEEVWEAIANEMRQDSPTGFWKHMIHRLRYDVELERVQEQGAKFSGGKVPPKLPYSDNLQFLSNMFRREKESPPEVAPMQLKSSGANLERHVSKNLRPVQNKPKTRTPITEKLASLEKLRNHHHNKLVLTPEAFRKMQKVTSGEPYYLTKTMTKNKS